MTTEFAEDPEILKQVKESSIELKRLLVELGGTEPFELHVIVNDWKVVAAHSKEVAEFTDSHPGWTVHNFPAWYSFKDGQGDDIVAVLTSRLINYQDAEKIANLVWSLGAQWSEVTPGSTQEAREEAKHAQTPWELEQTHGYLSIKATGDEYVIRDWDINEDPSVGITCNVERETANFQFIVKACNAYDELVEACKSWRELWELRPLDSGSDMQEVLRRCHSKTEKAINKAEGRRTVT